MTVAKFVQPNFTTQSAAAYKAAIDAAISVLQSIGGDFAPHAADSPNMQVVIDAGRIFKPGGEMVSVAQQITGSLIAPVTNPRIDRLVVDSENGIYSVLTGTAAASPTAPSIPNGKLPVAQISMTVGQTTIANSIITDERTTYGPLAKLMRMPVEAVSSTTGGFVREILLVDRGILFDCDCSNGPITILLPDTAQAGNGFMIGVVKTDATANEIIFVPSTTGEVFSDGSATKSVAAQNGTMIVTTDGLGQWYSAFDSSRTYENVTLSGATIFQSSAPSLTLIETDASVDNKRWQIYANAEALEIIAHNDAVTAAGAILKVERTGVVIDSVTLGGIFIPTSGQIKFPATQNASADANTLDDYEEGSWTPGLSAGTSGTITLAGTSVARYTKIGNSVNVRGNLVVSAISAPVGTLSVTGGPFSSQFDVGVAISPDFFSGLTNESIIAETQSSSIYIWTFLTGAKGNAADNVQVNTTINFNATFNIA